MKFTIYLNMCVFAMFSLGTQVLRYFFSVVTAYIIFTTKTRLFKYIKKILQPNKDNFRIKNSDIFHMSAQNINCGYSLEPPRLGGSNEYPQCMF